MNDSRLPDPLDGAAPDEQPPSTVTPGDVDDGGSVTDRAAPVEYPAGQSTPIPGPPPSGGPESDGGQSAAGAAARSGASVDRLGEVGAPPSAASTGPGGERPVPETADGQAAPSSSAAPPAVAGVPDATAPPAVAGAPDAVLPPVSAPPSAVAPPATAARTDATAPPTSAAARRSSGRPNAASPAAAPTAPLTGGFSRFPTAPVGVTQASHEPPLEAVAAWAPVESTEVRQGLAGWALTFAVSGLLVSLFVGWGFPIGLVGVITAIIALRRPMESRAVAVWALVLGVVSLVYSAGWLLFAVGRMNLFG